MNCPECKGYKGCTRNWDWFSYQDIRWCPWQVIWIIKNSEVFDKGRWPPDPINSNYIDPGIRTNFSGEAPFVKPAIVIAELDWRLERTGSYGESLVDEIRSGMALGDESQEVMKYVSGWRRKIMDFEIWQNQRNYRRGK